MQKALLLLLLPVPLFSDYFASRDQPYEDRVSIYKIDNCHICAACEIQKNKTFSALSFEERDSSSIINNRFTVKVEYHSGILPCSIGAVDGYYQADIRLPENNVMIIFTCDRHKTLTMLPENVLELALHSDNASLLEIAFEKGAELDFKKYLYKEMATMRKNLNKSIEHYSSSTFKEKPALLIPNVLVFLLENNYLAGTEMQDLCEMFEEIKNQHRDILANITEIIEFQDALEQLLL